MKQIEQTQLSFPATDARPFGEPAQPTNPLQLAHSLLRGRYWLALPLAILVAAPAAWFGYHLMPPKYTSVGLVRVRTTLPRLIYETEENETLPQFDSFVATQAALLQGQRVVEQAVQDERMRQAGWSTGLGAVAEVFQSLRVSHRRRTELIEVAVEHEDPLMAQAAVNSILDAYKDIYLTESQRDVSDIQARLGEHKAELEASIDTALMSKERIGDGLKTEEVNALVQDLFRLRREGEAKRKELAEYANSLESELSESGDADPEQESTPAPAHGDEEVPSIEILASMDGVLEDLLLSRSRVKAEIEVRSKEWLPRSAVMRELHHRLDQLEAEIDARTELLLARGVTGLEEMTGRVLSGPDKLAIVRKQIKAVDSRLAELDQELNSRIEQRSAMEAIEAELARLREELGPVTDRLNAMKMENENIKNLELSRIQIEQAGTRPLAPSTDRRLPLAGGLAGVAGGSVLGVFALIGLMHRQVRYVDEVEEESSIPFLGSVPVLSFRNREADELAALNVHHVRNLLQLQAHGAGHEGGIVYTMTSPAPGDGKTSLTLALGMSYAAAGFETIIVDADLVGRGLTRHFNLDRAAGLRDALGKTELNGQVRPTGVAHLRVIPVGRGSLQPEQVSQRDVMSLIENLRTSAQIVLIDTGPILGSLEADLLSVYSDAVVLTVTRGRRSQLVRAAIKRLRVLGATCAGLVFNRADHGDCQRSGSIMSMGMRSVRALPPSAEEMLEAKDEAARDAVIRAILGDSDDQEQERE